MIPRPISTMGVSGDASQASPYTGTPYRSPQLRRRDRNTWPSPVDSLPVTEGEPEGWHVRERMADGYPLMGSSPAEREESEARSRRIREQAMRDHPFEGDGPYCASWDRPTSSGGPETGVVTMRVMCGYPPELHPEAGA